MLRIIVTLALCAVSQSVDAADDEATAGPVRKKVLVELYTSQGCDSCPSANDFLGQLARLGYGPDRIVPIAFHVDYFNKPWVDPYSNNDFSRRELAYNTALKRDDLYFTPMMMIDGRYPMLGSNRPEAFSSLEKALKASPAASLKLVATGQGEARELEVEAAPLSTEARGRQVMVGVTVTEGPVSTHVASGENAGKTLVEQHAVRSFAYKTGKLDGKKTFRFSIKLAAGSVAANSRVSAWVQDWDNGKVFQADAIPWVRPEN